MTARWNASLALLLTGAVAACNDSPDAPADTCFSGRTRVRTPRGDRALEELAPGDEVLAAHPVTGVIATRRVVALLAHDAADTLTIDAADAHIVGVTAEHPIWVVSRDAWVAAGALAVGDVVAVFGETTTRTRVVESIRATGRKEPVYDLSVEGPEHTFFADDVLVHNKSVACESCRPPDADDGGSDATDAAVARIPGEERSDGGPVDDSGAPGPE